MNWTWVLTGQWITRVENIMVVVFGDILHAYYFLIILLPLHWSCLLSLSLFIWSKAAQQHKAFHIFVGIFRLFCYLTNILSAKVCMLLVFTYFYVLWMVFRDKFNKSLCVTTRSLSNLLTHGRPASNTKDSQLYYLDHSDTWRRIPSSHKKLRVFSWQACVSCVAVLKTPVVFSLMMMEVIMKPWEN